MKVDIAGYLQAGIAGLVAAAGSIFWAGSANSDIHQTQQQVTQLQQKQQDDHDKVTKLDQKLDDIQSDVSEIKSDVKSLVHSVH